MSAYLALFSARVRMLLQYRAAALAGMATQLFWGLIRIMIFEAFYRSSIGAQPMTYPEVVNYVWLGQAMFVLLPIFADAEIRAMVRTGTVAYELTRPIDLYTFWYCRALASRIAPAILRAIPIFCFALLFLGLQPPPSWSSAGAWALATLCALLLGGALATLANISLFWTVAGEGVFQIQQVALIIFSGLIVPLPLFPDWAQAILAWMPFGALVDLPFRLYMGHIPPGETWAVLARQSVWILALVALGRFLLARGTRRLVVQGG